MPQIRINTMLGIARLKAFLNLEGGVTRGAAPEPAHSLERRLQAANQRLAEQRRALEDGQQKIARLRRGLRSKDGPGLSAGRLPDFTIIGGRKCGTGLLYRLLCMHPQVEKAVKKEVHYFDLNYYWGTAWYRGHFPEVTERNGQKVLTGEASPYYLFHPHVPKRMAELVPRIKLIASLRNPVDRAYSHYYHEIRKNREPMPTFEEALEAEEGRLEGELECMLSHEHYASANHAHFTYLSRGIYVDQLKNWEKHYGRDQILVLKSEDLFDEERFPGVWKSLLDFLDLPEWHLEGEVPRVNRGDYPPMDPATRDRLREYFEPHNQRLYECLGRNLGW